MQLHAIYHIYSKISSTIVFIVLLSVINLGLWGEEFYSNPYTVQVGLSHSNAPQHLLFPGRDFLYLSNNYGKTWSRLDPKQNIPDSTYITAAAINPQNPGHFLLGTSFEGLFESTDGGITWEELELSLGDIYQGAGFYNEITGLLFSADGRELFIRTGFNDSIYLLGLETDILQKQDRAAANELRKNLIPAEHNELFNTLIINGISWPKNYPHPPEYSADNSLPNTFVPDLAWKQRQETASNKFGIYINAYQASTQVDNFIEYARAMGFNSVVVDFKDDQGLLRYQSDLKIVQDVGSTRPLFSAEELINKFHEAGIYVIARMVVFKDKELYHYDNNRYALWDSRLQEPWGVYRRYEDEPDEENPNPEPRIEQVEYWVDPYSQFVRDYNIQIAQELERIGVDEIQFDYIRFPSDGRTRDIVTRFLKDVDSSPSSIDSNNQRVRILTTFLAEARKEISIPIGTDVFGFNAWSRMSFLGQDIEAISHYVDVISPMSYPSHYPRNFYGEISYLDRAQLIYEEGTRRAREITNDRVVIRQYVQAFLIGGELQFEENTYFSYLDRQLNGTIQGGGNGFTLWNNSGRYYMVNEQTITDHIQSAFQTRNQE